MWVRAQVDYLQRLSTDKEKRKALKTLPPDLPQTYVRILETIDSTYPPLITKFIQRLFKWIVLQLRFHSVFFTSLNVNYLTSQMLRQAICIENETDRLSESEMPTQQQILGWLGCLVRRSKTGDMIELSHFTVQEFLKMNPEDVSSAVARRYLVQTQDHNYLVQVCLTYLMHDQFSSIKWSKISDFHLFRQNHPLYVHATMYLCDYVNGSILCPTGMNQEDNTRS